MKKEHQTMITEFEVILPTNEMETVGEKIKLSKFGEYCPDQSMRGYALLFMLDHPLHYRISQIMMMGKLFDIPADREQNYFQRPPLKKDDHSEFKTIYSEMRKITGTENKESLTDFINRKHGPNKE